MRTIRTGLTILALACGAVLVLGEVVARTARLPGRRLGDPVVFRCPALQKTRWHIEWHPDYLWTLKPSVELRSWGSEAPGTELVTDDHGFRRTAFPDTKERASMRGGQERERERDSLGVHR